MCRSPTRRATGQVNSTSRYWRRWSRRDRSQTFCVAGRATCGEPVAGGLAAAEGLSSWIPQSQSERAGRSIFPSARSGSWSARYDETVAFYRDIIGLPVLETFHAGYGTILGLPDGAVHLEIVRLPDARRPAPGVDQLVFYLPDAAAQERVKARFAASACSRSRRSITGRTMAASPIGTQTGGKQCSRPGSTARPPDSHRQRISGCPRSPGKARS